MCDSQLYRPVILDRFDISEEDPHTIFQTRTASDLTLEMLNVRAAGTFNIIQCTRCNSPFAAIQDPDAGYGTPPGMALTPIKPLLELDLDGGNE